MILNDAETAMTFQNALIVSHELAVQQALAAALAKHDLTTIITSSVADVEEVFSRVSISLVICSDELPGAGVDRVIQLAARTNKVPLIVVSRLDDWGRFLYFLQHGAFDYIVYPLKQGEVDRVVKNALSAVCLLRAGEVPKEMQWVLKRGA